MVLHLTHLASPSRRDCLAALCGWAAAAALPAVAQDYPTRPLRLIVPYAPGGATDGVARLIAENLAISLGQPVVVENRPGAASTIGMRALVAAPADGYTIALADDATLYNNWHLFKDLPYTLESFQYAAMVGRSPLVLMANRSAGVKTLDEFVQWARRNPGKVNYGTPGAATPHHLAAAAINEHFKLAMEGVHYKGSAAAIGDLFGGQVQVLFAGSVFATQYANDARVVSIAVTSAERLKTLPDVPTLKEAGFDAFDATAELGLLMSREVPNALVERIHTETSAMLQRPVVQERFQKMGIFTSPMSRADFKSHVERRAAQAGVVIRRSNISLA